MFMCEVAKKDGFIYLNVDLRNLDQKTKRKKKEKKT